MKRVLSELIVIVHNVRSAHNVGSIFRTADGAGFSKVYLTGYTPAPVDRFGRSVKEIAKTALGAEISVPWEKIASLSKLITQLKSDGVLICAVEQSPRSVPYQNFKTKKPVALLVGNEVRGLGKREVAHADHVLEIPMNGAKESLNVSVAFGIVAYAFATNRKTSTRTH